MKNQIALRKIKLDIQKIIYMNLYNFLNYIKVNEEDDKN